MGGKLFNESHLRFSPWNLLYSILIWITKDYPIFISVIIITNSVEVDNNAHNESIKVGYEETLREKNIHSTVFVSITVLTKNVDVGNNEYDE